MARKKSTTETAGVRSVERAIAILNAFSKERPSLSVLELQEIVGLSRPTLYRLLETLGSHGLIRIHGSPQRFSLDYAAGRIGHAWSSGLAPVAVAKPILDRLHDITRETVALVARRGHEHLYVVELPSPHVLSMSRGIGPMDHLTKGASGKTILAAMSDIDVESALASAPKGTDLKRVRSDLEKIRADGYFVAHSEIFSGAVGIAASFFDHSLAVAGAVIVFGPTVRFDEATIAKTIPLVTTSADELSRALGDVRPRRQRIPISGSVRSARLRK
ncbi:MAG: IclR family transcriptional regulator [Hyphomicrobiaceae bacterium]|nr:IclR family transcriptional regulator [Hyphomicrobiaceae bacterium]